MTRSAEFPGPAKPDSPLRESRLRLKKAVIHILVGAHLAAVICWSFLPANGGSPLGRVLRPRLAHYMLPTGFWQTWDMFGNSPLSNNYLEAEVTFADGSRATWPFPRVERLPYFQRYRAERYRKWATERVIAAGDPSAVVVEAAAKFAARQVERPGNPARKVELIRYRSQTPPPRRGQLRPHSEPPGDWERQLLYTCEFDATGQLTSAGLATQPAATQPAATQPGDAQPGATRPGSDQPAEGSAEEGAAPDGGGQ
jgi:hypothetical protein